MAGTSLGTGKVHAGNKRVEFVFPDVDSALEADLAFPPSSQTDGRVIRVPLADLAPVKRHVMGVLRRDGFEFIVRRAGRRVAEAARKPGPLRTLSALLMRPFAAGVGDRAA